MNFLLINPYIYDFACYDYWLKPLGLLYLSSLLKSKGHSVNLIDCMDRHHPALPEINDDEYGTGRFISAHTVKPEVLRKYKRYYKIYGIHGELLEKLLKSVPRPDFIVLTSGMTYWYPGIRDLAELTKKIFPETPAALGGIYATLCSEHAKKNIPVDYVIKGSDLKEFFSIINEKTESFSDWPGPDYSSYKKLPYAVFRTSIGCLKNCSFCGVKAMHGGFTVKSAQKIKGEIEYITEKFNVRDIVFYDDSLLENKGLTDFLSIAPEGLRFHTPNALEVCKISKDAALLLKNSGFVSPCLAIDIVDPDRMRSSGGKLDQNAIEQAVRNLTDAGYKKGEISGYLIMGLPGQSIKEIYAGVDFVHNLGVKIRLAEYAVVPESIEGKKFSREIIDEPLLHNNSIFPAYQLSDWENLFKVKEYAAGLNHNL